MAQFSELPKELIRLIVSRLTVCYVKNIILACKDFSIIIDWVFLAALFKLPANDRTYFFTALRTKYPIWEQFGQKPISAIANGRMLETFKYDYRIIYGKFKAYKLLPMLNKFSVKVLSYPLLLNSNYPSLKIGISLGNGEFITFVINSEHQYFSLEEVRKNGWSRLEKTITTFKSPKRYRQGLHNDYYMKSFDSFTFSIKYNFETHKVNCYANEVGFKATSVRPFDCTNAHFFVKIANGSKIQIV